MAEHFDFILAGGGAAGLSLAYHIIHSPLNSRSILIVDRDEKRDNDRTWCAWSNQPGIFDPIVYHSWNQIRVINDETNQTIPLGSYHYKLIRGIDFYQYIYQALRACANVHFLQGNVEALTDGERPEVVVSGKSYQANWVFDSLFKPEDYQQQAGRYHYLMQHFKGWLIETKEGVFDPLTVTLFDFRLPQNGEMRFIYILPFTERKAIVEFTVFSTRLLGQDEYREGLIEYLSGTLGCREYRILEEENGIIPMTDRPYPRRLGRRIMAIGTRGGRVKPSSGYAFNRIQKDSAAIVNSLIKNGHPFAVPPDPWRYRLFDTIMLQVMYRQGDQMATIFPRLFKRNPLERIFRFLDETASIGENMRILSSLPMLLFMKALIKVKVFGRI
jgi:lycopene beta-cyclase